MAQVYYRLISEDYVERDGERYTCENWHMNFNDFIQKHSDCEIYINQASLGTEVIRAVIFYKSSQTDGIC